MLLVSRSRPRESDPEPAVYEVVSVPHESRISRTQRHHRPAPYRRLSPQLLHLLLHASDVVRSAAHAWADLGAVDRHRECEDRQVIEGLLQPTHLLLVLFVALIVLGPGKLGISAVSSVAGCVSSNRTWTRRAPPPVDSALAVASAAPAADALPTRIASVPVAARRKEPRQASPASYQTTREGAYSAR